MKNIFLVKQNNSKLIKITNSFVAVITVHFLIYAMFIRIALNLNAEFMIILGAFSQYITFILLILVLVFIAKFKIFNQFFLSIKFVIIMAFFYQLLFLFSGEMNNRMLQASYSKVNLFFILTIAILIIALNNYQLIKEKWI